MTIRGMIFDIDGTLVDTNPAHVQAWRQAFMDHGFEVSAERIRPEIGKGGDNLVPAILGDQAEQRHGKALRQRHTELFHHIAEYQPIRVFPGVYAFFEVLKVRQVKTALATSSTKDQLEVLQKSAGIDFSVLADHLATADDADASKPAPDVVLAAVRKLNLPAEQCLLVGDTVHDAEAARRAGMPFVAVLCGGCSSTTALGAAGAHSVWSDPADLLAHLDKAVPIAVS